MNERIRILRNTLNLTQKNFAEQIGLKQNAVSCMEKPGTTVTRQNIIAICKCFNVNEDWIYYGTGEMFIEYDSKKNEFMEIFNKLSPILQDYLIKTAKDLLEVQHKLSI